MPTRDTPNFSPNADAVAKSAVRTKPRKPYPDFPLFSHPTGRWARKIRGKFHYFGKWDAPDAALQKYLNEKDALHAGRTPRSKSDGLTLRDLCNRFLTAKQLLVESGDIVELTFIGYFKNRERVIANFGRNLPVEELTAENFAEFRSKLAKHFSPSTLATEIRNTKVLFKWGFDSGLLKAPPRYGQSFRMPSGKVMRQARQANGPRMFEADALRSLLAASDVSMRAMILLAINCGYGQSDIANLPVGAVDLETRWAEFPRPKLELNDVAHCGWKPSQRSVWP